MKRDAKECIGCGCTEKRACEGGCSWAREGLCTRCVIIRVSWFEGLLAHAGRVENAKSEVDRTTELAGLLGYASSASYYIKK